MYSFPFRCCFPCFFHYRCKIDFRAAVEGKGFFDARCAVAPVIFALLGLFLIAVLEWKKVKGSVMMPLTYSISNGIAIGSIAYIVSALLRGKFTKKNIVLAIVSVLFIIRFFTISF